jgi:hypothetical protein
MTILGGLGMTGLVCREGDEVASKGCLRMGEMRSVWLMVLAGLSSQRPDIMVARFIRITW